MTTVDMENQAGATDAQALISKYEREIRKLNREVTHLKQAIFQEKTAYTTILNQQKASTFIQRERERYLSLLLANSPSIILFLSQMGRVEFCTEYFMTKAGYEDATEVLGHTLTEVVSPFLDRTCHDLLMEQSGNVIKTNEPHSFDITFCFHEGGEKEDFAGLIVPMKDLQQHVNGIMLLLHDVTDLKRSREEALAASRAKSAFLSNMSHEIRTPMNAIIGMTSIGKLEKTLERKDYAFEKIENASAHLLGVINDILDISKIESGKMELSYITFSLSKMLNRVMSVIAQKMHEKRQGFSVEIDPSIPDRLFGDDQRLAQVITNILANAVKFTPDEGRIVFSAQLLSMQGNKCTIQMSVEDSGIGMSRKEQNKLFNIFQQAEAGTARKYGGSGLGLAISKRILELMDGDIRVESEPGKGSNFFFTAILCVPEPDEHGAEDLGLVSCEQEKKATDLSGKVILLVDDVDINLEIVTVLLEPTNVTIDTAKNGGEAYDLFAGNPGRHDLILMDVQMPEIDGLECTKMIRAIGTPQAVSIPIIAMTANVFKEDIQKCIDSGMNDHLGKPIDIDEVTKLLSYYLIDNANLRFS